MKIKRRNLDFVITREPDYDMQECESKTNAVLFLLTNSIDLDFECQDEPIPGTPILLYNWNTRRFYYLMPNDVEDFYSNRPMSLVSMNDDNNFTELFSCL